mmetsp:Transcript_25201/g.35520  ORF Transcript_25201/g.35520 Transcript_25201/m.35520 type:complete len:198 (+) Transcript_25201:157-750(+)
MVLKKNVVSFLAGSCALIGGASAFSASNKLSKSRMNSAQVNMVKKEAEENAMSRRDALFSGSAFVAASLIGTSSPAIAQDEVEWTPFNGLIFNYRGSDSNTGLDASDLDEPSVPFQEFLDKMSANQVDFVEFIAPNGDAAYATFKGEDGKSLPPIRIGQGYPIEISDSWSSPAFVVRICQNKKVPYKFTLPALAAYK